MFWHKHELICSTSPRSVPALPQLLKPQRVLQVFRACELLSKDLGENKLRLTGICLSQKHWRGGGSKPDEAFIGIKSFSLRAQVT
jgi:hypothetical protein